MKDKFTGRKNNGVLILVVSVVIVIALATSLIVTIHQVSEKSRQYCFEDLNLACNNLSTGLYKAVYSDRHMLQTIASNLARDNDITQKDIVDAMNSFRFEDSYVTYIVALLPDNKLLTQKGTLQDVSDKMSFTKEVKRGEYFSSRMRSIIDTSDYVSTNVVPAVRDGKVVCILYGVISLKDFAQQFTTDIYDGEAIVYLVDGDNGNLFLDTQNNTVGNLYEFDNIYAISGYSLEKAVEEIKAGMGGDVAFVSEPIGKTIYMHYEPVGINNWSIVIAATEDVAFARTKSISKTMYIMATVMGLIFILSMICIIKGMLSNYKVMRNLTIQDSITCLQNRTAYDVRIESAKEQIFSYAACMYFDANGLHEVNNKYGHATGDQMLKIIADSIRNQFGYENVYRVGGDEFVAFCINGTTENCLEKVRIIHEQVEKHGYTVASGFACQVNEKGFDRIVRDADADMVENKRIYYASHDRRFPRN